MSAESVTCEACAVDWCDKPVTVWSERIVEGSNGEPLRALVPFCRDHGPKVGSDV